MLELAQAQVMVVALKRDVGELAIKRIAQTRQLMIDELVHEGVGLCRDTHRDLVLARAKGDGHEICHRLANARPGFDDAYVAFA